MIVRLTRDVYHDNTKTRDKLKKGTIVRAYIAEQENTESDPDGWFLIDTGYVVKNNYVSNFEVESGKLIQTYRDPELPHDYGNGPYMWIGNHEAEIIGGTNKEAKFLLKKHEWHVE